MNQMSLVKNSITLLSMYLIVDIGINILLTILSANYHLSNNIWLWFIRFYMICICLDIFTIYMMANIIAKYQDTSNITYVNIVLLFLIFLGETSMSLIITIVQYQQLVQNIMVHDLVTYLFLFKTLLMPVLIAYWIGRSYYYLRYAQTNYTIISEP